MVLVRCAQLSNLTDAFFHSFQGAHRFSNGRRRSSDSQCILLRTRQRTSLTSSWNRKRHCKFLIPAPEGKEEFTPLEFLILKKCHCSPLFRLFDRSYILVCLIELILHFGKRILEQKRNFSRECMKKLQLCNNLEKQRF